MPPDDIYSILMGSEPEAADSARAMASAIRRQRQSGLASTLGDRKDPIGAFGKANEDFAKQDQGLMERAAQSRLHFSPQKEAMDEKQAMLADPLTGEVLTSVGHSFGAPPNFDQAKSSAKLALLPLLERAATLKAQNALRASLSGGAVPSGEALQLLIDKVQAKGGISPGDVARGPSAPAVTKAIWEGLAERAKNNPISLATNAAKYKGQEGAYANLVKIENNMKAFEGTARANLGLMLETVSKIVDSGSPAANQPLRALANSALGSPEQAAFNAARRVAGTETARVLQSVQGSGVLSDEARREIDTILSQDATPRQLRAAVSVLMRDMDNRAESYARTRKELEGGFDANAHPQGATSGPVPAAVPPVDRQALRDLYLKR